MLVGKNPDQNGDDTLGNDGIAVGGKHQLIALQFGMYPYLTLASFDDIIIVFEFDGRSSKGREV